MSNFVCICLYMSVYVCITSDHKALHQNCACVHSQPIKQSEYNLHWDNTITLGLRGNMT